MLRDLYEAVPDLPGEDAWGLPLVVFYPTFDVGGGHPGFTAPDDARPDTAGLLVSVEDLGDAAVGHPQLPRDNARTYSGGGHLHNLEADVVRQRSSIDEYSTQLVHPYLALSILHI